MKRTVYQEIHIEMITIFVINEERSSLPSTDAFSPFLRLSSLFEPLCGTRVSSVVQIVLSGVPPSFPPPLPRSTPPDMFLVPSIETLITYMLQ